MFRCFLLGIFLCACLLLPGLSAEAADNSSNGIVPAAVPLAAKPPLQELIEGGALTEMGLRHEEGLLKDFYARRHYLAAWELEGGDASQTIKEFINYMRDALAENGLSERNYPFATLQQLADTKELLKAELWASAMVLRLSQSLAGQEKVPRAGDQTWPLQAMKNDTVASLSDAVDAHHVEQYLADLTPHVPAYIALKQALQHYRAIFAEGGWQPVRPGKILIPGVEDERLPTIIAHLVKEGYLLPQAQADPAAVISYDDGLLAAVKAFQQTHGLYPNGQIGPETYRALNVPVEERIDQLRVNLARLRQTPPDFAEGIVINIPAARLTYYEQGKPVYEAPVVVGRVDRPSPLVSSAINEIIINPFWYVPASIARKDLLPQVEDDPYFLTKLGISQHAGTQGEAMLRQDPGPKNSLGRIKFNFPNRFAVYLHGTPHLELFARDDRTRSSGCIRLKEPEQLAEILMQHDPAYSGENLQKKIDSLKTRHVTPPQHTPIKLLYWTAFPDGQARVQFYNDVYGLDKAWLDLL